MKNVHFLGIGGSGASAVANIAQAQGFKVTGCDENPQNEFTENFKNSQLFQGHSSDHLFCHTERQAKGINEQIATDGPRNDKSIDILAVTPAIFSVDPDNEELKAAKEKGIPVMQW